MTFNLFVLTPQRDACCPCWVHTNWTPNRLSRKGLMNIAFSGYAKVLTSVPAKITVLLVAAVITGIGIWGNVLLKQEFQIRWFFPKGSSLDLFFDKSEEYFPNTGFRVTVFLHEIDYGTDLARVQAFVDDLRNQTDIVNEVDSWTDNFVKYVNNHFVPSSADSEHRLPALKMNSSLFNDRLSQFLHSPNGGKYRARFKFDGELKCGEPAPELMLTDLTFLHLKFSGPSEHVPAMNRVKNLIAVHLTNISASGRGAFPFSKIYPSWETDEVISEELYRNIGLAVLAVYLTTLFLLSDLISSFLVLLCVVLCLVDIGGFMHFWGLTIDTVTCQHLIIAIGLCVDYSAHIAHRFLVEQGTRNERAVKTLQNIGPAVLNGGISTLLAFVLLASSKSYVFMSFFKVFFLVVTFGLFQGSFARLLLIMIECFNSD